MGENNREIANELKVSLDTARLWRQRWLDLQPISLEDLSIEVLQPDNGKAIQMDILGESTYCLKLGLFKPRCTRPIFMHMGDKRS